jgi:hypothetical protein
VSFLKHFYDTNYFCQISISQRIFKYFINNQKKVQEREEEKKGKDIGIKK